MSDYLSSLPLVAEPPETVSPRQGRAGQVRCDTDPLHTASADRRHSFVTTSLDAGVGLRDVLQIAARHADPRTTSAMPGRARQNLDRHPNYILATYMASGI
jgi:hypothetical protein